MNTPPRRSDEDERRDKRRDERREKDRDAHHDEESDVQTSAEAKHLAREQAMLEQSAIPGDDPLAEPVVDPVTEPQRADLADESQQRQLDDIQSEGMDTDELFYGGDETDFDLEYYDNEDETIPLHKRDDSG